MTLANFERSLDLLWRRFEVVEAPVRSMLDRLPLVYAQIPQEPPSEIAEDDARQGALVLRSEERSLRNAAEGAVPAIRDELLAFADCCAKSATLLELRERS
jgi:hypothetical protein